MKGNNIYEAVWLDKDFRRYDMPTQMTFLYLLTNANSAGIIVFDPDIFEFVSKIEEKKIMEALRTLAQRGKVIYDPETSEVFLLNHFKYNNPATSTFRHKLKFKMDISTIKSGKIHTEVGKRAQDAILSVKDIGEEPKKPKAKPVKKPHVDKH